MKKWLIYKHTNNKSGKSYIGLTSRTMDIRWEEHVSSANSGSPFHFHNALRKYPVNTWTHDILVDNIRTFEEAQLTERSYIREYDSLDNGYNMTIGGEWLCDGRNAVNKVEVPRMKTKVEEVVVAPKKKVYKTFKFIHKTHGVIHATVRQLRLKYRLRKSSVLALVRGERKRVMGWKVHKD